MVAIISFATAVLTNTESTFILDGADTHNQIVKLREKEVVTALEDPSEL